MGENAKPFAFFSMVALYALFVIAFTASCSKTIQDEYFVHDALITSTDCKQIDDFVSGTVSCPAERQADGSRRQKIIYRASIWDDIPIDRERLEPRNEKRDAVIAHDKDWIPPSLITLFAILVAVELLQLLHAFWGEEGRKLQVLEPRDRRRAALAAFVARGLRPDYRFSVAVFLFGGVSLFALGELGWIPTRDLGAVSILAFVLGLGGAAYAILSKLMADKVFDQTVEIHKSITSFFGGYDEITDETGKRSAAKLIGTAKRSLVIYTGSPLITFFRDPRSGIFVANQLISKITEMDLLNHKFSVKLMYYSDAREKKYLDALEMNPAPIQGRMASEWRKTYLDTKKALLDTIESMPGGTGKIYQHPDEEPQVRFIIKDGDTALFWILEAANPSGAVAEAQTGKAGAAGFSTTTWHMINILLGLFGNAEAQAMAAAPPPPPPPPPPAGGGAPLAATAPA